MRVFFPGVVLLLVVGYLGCAAERAAAADVCVCVCVHPHMHTMASFCVSAHNRLCGDVMNNDGCHFDGPSFKYTDSHVVHDKLTYLQFGQKIHFRMLCWLSRSTTDYHFLLFSSGPERTFVTSYRKICTIFAQIKDTTIH